MFLFDEESWGATIEKLMIMKAAAGGGLTEYTETGNPAAFETNVAKALTGFTIPFTPVQSGSGDPSPENNRPISGWMGVKAYRTGKNIWDFTAYDGGSYNPTVGDTFTLTKSATQPTDNGDGTFTVSFTSTWGYKTFICPVVPGNTYYRYVKFLASGNKRITYGALDANFKVLTRNNSTSTNDITLNDTYSPTEARYFYVVLTNASSSNISVTIEYPQIEVGSTKTDYEEFVGNSFPVVFPAEAGTVYGGELDLVTGVLTVTHKVVDLSTLDWELRDTGFYRTGVISDMLAVGANMERVDGYAEKYSVSAYADLTSSAYGIGVNTLKRIFVGGGSVGSGNFVYPLETPLTFHLDPVTIQTLVGDNVVWTDTNGTNTIKYLKKG